MQLAALGPKLSRAIEGMPRQHVGQIIEAGDELTEILVSGAVLAGGLARDG